MITLFFFYHSAAQILAEFSKFIHAVRPLLYDASFANYRIQPIWLDLAIDKKVALYCRLSYSGLLVSVRDLVWNRILPDYRLAMAGQRKVR